MCHPDCLDRVPLGSLKYLEAWYVDLGRLSLRMDNKFFIVLNGPFASTLSPPHESTEGRKLMH